MKIVLGVILAGVLLCIAFVAIYGAGEDSGARQMARHILNPAFETESFYSIMNEECGSDKGWRKMNGNFVFYKDGITIDGRCLTSGERKLFEPN